GTVAMANSGPDTNGSQFFLVYEDSSLPPNFTPFGKIVSGMDVLEEVAAAGSDESNGTGDGKPNLPIVLEYLYLGNCLCSSNFDLTKNTKTKQYAFL
ncbi:MAG: peptidylprolyl isomerase, partial [Bacteroidetes bacterium]|nr:peptidylprolyl isomerase [Bacteroidota bacterium]